MKTLPTIHTNGTSATELYGGWINAADACGDAIRAIEQIEFNARDYYPQGPDAFDRARNELAQHVEAIRRAKAAFVAVAEHVSPYVK